MLRSILKGRLFGHPVHPMLVHFPTALFSSGFLFDILGKVLGDSSFYPASLYVILMGLGFGVLAAVFGFLDYVKLGDRPEAFTKASWHGGIQFMVLVMFGIIAGIKFQSYPDPAVPDLWQFIIMGCGVVLMLAGNYLGGELVFTHRVGTGEKENNSSEI